ncbi:DnaJ family domain-containing protein [Bacillus sp. V33-4]|uniref:DnaJ family domain-containing protein n=1 Tax=Bacillus sp. V33-4 TaxID=2054169 RepID=UPI000C765F86|nr:DnaJ family domain-containing protein [Bacillus sp. V33-4]PLR87061.1 DUF1992 domain-containing protein [Bacillus sp. V33-4]
MDFASIVSEDKIRKAYENGEFDHLPGFGKPLPRDDAAAVPPELRMAYRMLKNAGYSTEENRLKQEMLSLEDLIKSCENDEEKEQLQKKLNEKILRFNSMMAKRRANTNSNMFKNYEQKINSKLF